MPMQVWKPISLLSRPTLKIEFTWNEIIWAPTSLYTLYISTYLLWHVKKRFQKMKDDFCNFALWNSKLDTNVLDFLQLSWCLSNYTTYLSIFETKKSTKEFSEAKVTTDLLFSACYFLLKVFSDGKMGKTLPYVMALKADWGVSKWPWRCRM